MPLIEMAETAAHGLTEFLSSNYAYAAAATGLAALGIVPRVGPGRAIALALRSRFLAAGTRPSQRSFEVKRLRAMTEHVAADQFCIVVGPKGVGTTCIVDTATSRTWGVVRVRIRAGAQVEEIVHHALLAVTRSRLPHVYIQSSDAWRVMWCHRLIFRVPPTIILEAAEHEAGKDYAEITASCRTLVEGYGFRVIVDASHYSLNESAYPTGREKVLTVKPMPRELLEDLVGLGDLIRALRAAELDDVVWALIGGNPADYFKLDGLWNDAKRGDAITAVVERFVLDVLGKAIKTRDATLTAHARLAPLLTLFASTDVVPLSTLREMRLARPNPDMVLRQVTHDLKCALVPSTQAMAVVLRHGLKNAVSLDALKALLLKGETP